MKIACCSTLNDLYFEGFLTFFYSLKQHNPSFNLPYYIFTWGELSDTNIAKLKRAYHNFKFKNIDNSRYNGVEYSTKWRNWNINCINRFEIFTLSDYDKIIFLDADMLVLGNIDYLFNINVDFGACEIVKGSEMDHPGKFNKTLKSFDGGLMVISKKYLNHDTQKALIDIALQKKWTSDEPILNVYFDNNKTTYLSKEYNLLSPEISDGSLKTAKIIQFVGVKKPWYKGQIEDRYDNYTISKMANLPLLLKVDNLYKRYYNNTIAQYV